MAGGRVAEMERTAITRVSLVSRSCLASLIIARRWLVPVVENKDRMEAILLGTP
jgi:hypothetical protein